MKTLGTKTAPRRLRLAMALAAALGLLTATPGAALAGASAPLLRGDGGVPSFYVWNGALDGRPGKLLRSESLPPALELTNAARSLRLLYTSTDGLDGKSAITVSGALFLPKGPTPSGGWPLLAWAHGTVGVADVCAPSFAGRSLRDVTYLNFWLARGYAIVASDYQGLGVPGGHPYLATRPEAYSVLDSIRAVQGGPFPLSRKVVLIGQSQGAGAAFATAGYAPLYAPDLMILGTVATGTPYFSAEAVAALQAARKPGAVDPTLAYSFYALSLTEAVDPSFRVSDYVSPEATLAVLSVANTCIGPLEKQIVAQGLTSRQSFKKDIAPLMRRTYGLAGYATLKIPRPVFMGTGEKDHDVPAAMQLRLGADACAAGSVIEQHVYPGLDHSGTVNGSTPDSSVFVQRLFAGETISGNCSSRPSVPAPAG